jgi:hypothetical protein
MARAITTAAEARMVFRKKVMSDAPDNIQKDDEARFAGIACRKERRLEITMILLLLTLIYDLPSRESCEFRTGLQGDCHVFGNIPGNFAGTSDFWKRSHEIDYTRTGWEIRIRPSCCPTGPTRH